MTLRNLPRPLAAALLIGHATALAGAGGVAAGGGYQFIASITPRFFATIAYAPVAGVRVVFG